MPPRTALTVLGTLLAACASTPPEPAPLEVPAAAPPAAPAADDPGLSYDAKKLEILQKMVAHQGTHMFYRPGGYEQQASAETIDAAAARALIEGHQTTSYPNELQPLFEHDDALFLYADLDAQVDVPEGLLVVPMPTTGFDPELSKRLQPGFIIMLGVEHTGDELNPTLPEEEPETAEETELPTIDAATFRAKMAAGETFTVVLSSKGCANSRAFVPALVRIVEDEAIAEVYDLPWDAAEANQELAKELLPRPSFPTLLHIHDGRLTDYYSGAGSHWEILHLLARNGLIDQEVPWVHDERGPSGERLPWLRGLAIGRKGLSATNFEGANLEGVVLRRGSLAGSILRHANLRGADLRQVAFSHADLTGADLTDARLDGALWANTTCPDGTNSDDNGDTCLGHESAEPLNR